MAALASYSEALDSLTKALNSAHSSLEKLETPLNVEQGISLFDVKNEIFLSYLHNLVFLLVLNLRHQKSPNDKETQTISDSVTKKLVELQIYIDKGVRPLENRLKYQLEKVFRAADNAKISESITASKSEKNASQSDSEDESEDNSDEESVANAGQNISDIHELQYRPNPASFHHHTSKAVAQDSREKIDSGIYKPPKIHATLMPMVKPQENGTKKLRKLATIDEFINHEMSSVPIAEPSIGSTIKYGGRRSLSQKEINEEKEKREYEEQNYIRLPTGSKKERAKKKGSINFSEFGGEELMKLGQGIDRIDRLTKRKSGENRSSILERSRKRLNENESNYTSSQVGQSFQKRVKRLDRSKKKN
ncbi:putative u3 small nucleolar ribonucleoprotein lcp5 [Erysiphe necator]|uniref:Putative u3 small nucleolar ribonucleoprotein lcp5 n=1 Tax=Uncinula necator TaxID=52586 RepID=A0A0B1PEX0_UNCNE|nr:putative u3 small nucleolar ribonucleoprotein lcp5 [Erysiphe necator]